MNFLIKKMAASLTLLCIMFTACNKEELDAERAMDVVINGYTDGANPLQIAIDTTEYEASWNYGKFIIKPGVINNLDIAYSYRTSKKRMITLTDTVTKEVVYRSELPASGTKANFSYIFVNGKELSINPPAVDPATNKLGFYIHYPESDDAFDVSLYRIDGTTGQEFRTYLAKNVKPGAWFYIDYVAAANFTTKNMLSSTQLCFTKAGSVNEWAFENNETKSRIAAPGLFLPIAGETGLVQPYFITPQPYDLGYSQLFFYPDRL